jgi:pimeloyl-ACP methyl ester carboxylesterase
MQRMPRPKIPHPKRHLQPTDLRALVLLATEATAGLTAMTEGVHQSVWRTLGAPSGATPAHTRGLTGLVYQSIHGVTQWVGRNVANALERLEPLLQKIGDQVPESAERVALQAALNGVIGDRLAASQNPLNSPMTLRIQERESLISTALDVDLTLKTQLPHASSKLLLVVHGLCMNDLQWNSPGADGHHNHAHTLADTLGYTPVYLRYNTGLHISDNAQALAAQLEALFHHWPVPLTEISVLGHSMGGLVTRSAVHQAKEAGMRWPGQLKNIVFLGTPHHGSPLERAGNWVDVILGSTPYSAPFAKLGQLRSAGVTDLRYGHVLQSDWQEIERFRRKPDRRTPVPLPDGVRCFTVAATTAAKRSPLADRLIGDGLVPLHSALGLHDAPARCLHFAPDHQFIAYKTSHLALLSSPAVTAHLVQWLTTAKGPTDVSDGRVSVRYLV